MIDSGFNPYHVDFSAGAMPQHLDGDVSNDLPLHVDPALWIKDHPGADAFNSYQPLHLSIPSASASGVNTDELATSDAGVWAAAKPSTYEEGNAGVNFYWIPGTKIVGYVTDRASPADSYGGAVHGQGSASVAAGNVHGTCPTCLVVLVDGDSQASMNWIAKQKWIDVQTNSWSESFPLSLPAGRTYIDRSTTWEGTRDATNRGQQVFVSSGNGHTNTSTDPNNTLLRTKAASEWHIVVGGIEAATDSVTSGSGKPVDVAAPADDYPSGSASTNDGEGTHSGTSNATPVIAGIFAEALYRVRARFGSAKRIQSDGVVAAGPPGCGAANTECPTRDGVVTFLEMREALFMGGSPTENGYSFMAFFSSEPLASMPTPGTENLAEGMIAGLGHGAYRGKYNSAEQYEAEVSSIVDYIFGDRADSYPQEEIDWFTAYSMCRQAMSDSWEYAFSNDHQPADATPAWPVRTFMSELCPYVGPYVPENPPPL